MRRAMGSGQREQEVLIQTSTGFFRFHGISEKFTRRLYEWEKARGIGPEESTFALLDPGYRPVGNGIASSHGKNPRSLHGKNKHNSLLTRIWVRLKTVLIIFERTANFITSSNRNNPNFLIWWRQAYLQNCNIYIYIYIYIFSTGKINTTHC